MAKPKRGGLGWELEQAFREHPRTLGGQKAALDKEPHKSLFLEVIEYAESSGDIPCSDNRLYQIMRCLCEARGFMVVKSPTTFMRYLQKHPDLARRIGRD